MPESGSGDRDSARALTSLLIDSVVDYAIFVLDTDGRVRSWNPGAERLKGYTADEIVGHDFSVFYTEEDRDAGLPARLLGQAVDEGRVVHTGWRVRRDGTRFYGDVTITALRDEDGVLRGFAKVTRDRTEHHRAEEAMALALERERRATHELTRLREERSQFMAAVSHDLRTPLVAIQGGLQLLEDELLEGEEGVAPELLGLLGRNVDRLIRMSQQLSEVSRLERGRTDVAPEPVDLAEAVEECVLALRPVLGDRDVRTEVAGVVAADPLALQRVLTNLLANAHRHGPTGTSVEVTSRVGASEVLLVVEDAGPGVPPEERERVFGEFQQGDGQPRGDGLGLGLAIVRRYVEAHGGRVWVEDRDGGGARFCLTLPTADGAGAST